MLSDFFSFVPPRIYEQSLATTATCSKAGSLLLRPASPQVVTVIFLCCACREDEERVSSHSQLQHTSAQVAHSAGRQSPQDGPSKRTVTRPAERLMHEEPASQQPISGPASEVHVRSDVQQVGAGQQPSCMQRLGICQCHALDWAIGVERCSRLCDQSSGSVV